MLYTYKLCYTYIYLYVYFQNIKEKKNKNKWKQSFEGVVMRKVCWKNLKKKFCSLKLPELYTKCI